MGMLDLPGYMVEKQIYRGSRWVFYSGKRREDHCPVTIKTPHPTHPTARHSAQIVHEYQLMKGLHIQGVPGCLAIEKHLNGLVLVMEEINGLPLHRIIHKKGMALLDFLEIAIALSKTIGELHQNNVIHKDIHPESIFVQEGSNRVWLLNYGIASFLPRESPKTLYPHMLEGALAYMSPEQTGRMNRALDYRTDFYSLGVVCYERLTGKLPFGSKDPLELVHDHLARKPLPLHEVNPKVPGAVSNIVLKLLAKTAEDRYQSARGLKRDFEECLGQLRRKGRIDPFQPGKDDVPDRFQVSQKLYGRERETATLVEMFERASRGGIETAMVSGYAGVGKTSLVREIYKPLTGKKGYFISGKFEQFHRNIPYSAIVHSFQGLMKQLLAESESNLKQWKKILQTALGANAQIIIDVIPHVEMMVGPQPPVRELRSAESQNRFNRVFLKFIRAFCKKDHPLVIFLDDLQWVDTDSLKLIELMMSDEETKHLFLICAYRDNEVDSTHPFMAALKKIKKRKRSFTHVALDPLGFHHISSLIADTLHREKSAVLPLADLVVCKTNGNPFFVNQFLTTLYQKRLLLFNSEAGRWKWDLSEIRALDITDNVIDLLVHRLQRMRLKTRHVLRRAACMGNCFDLRTLGLITHEPPANILESLLPAMEEDLIVSTSGFRAPKEVRSDDPILLEVFRFRHDRVQQAAYALIDEKDRKKVHLQIGRLLMERNETGKLEEELFDIINHLNFGADLIGLQSERNELAALNLRAARKARASAAFEPALDYLNTGIHLLSENSWGAQYDLTLALYAECVEAARILGNFQLMEELSAVVTRNARTPLDQVSVFRSRIQRCMAENELSVALNTAFEMLYKLGEEIPKHSTPAQVEITLDATLSSLGERRIEDLIDLPEMTDPFKLAAMSILATVTSAAYIGAPELFPLIVCKGVNLSIGYGNTSDSAVAYVAFGVILCKKGEDISSGYRFGRLSLNLVKRFNAREHEAKVYHVASCYITHWKKHVLETLGPALKGYYSGLETGDLEFAGYGVYCHGKHAFFAGRPLAEVESEMVRYGEAVKKLKQETPARYNDIFHQAVLNLMGKSAEPDVLAGEAYNETTMAPYHRKANDRLAIMFFHFSKLVLCYLFEHYPRAIENANLAEKEIARAAGGPLAVSLFHFYDSLARLAAYFDCPESVRKAYLLKIAANQKKLGEWAAHAPMNHSHKFHLVEAELSRILGNDLKAIEHYDLAIMLAGRNGYINEEALANELAAKYWLDRSRKALAAPLMQRAYDCYALWGARGKILQLEKKYQALLSKGVHDAGLASLSHAPPELSFGFRSSEGLDLSTMIKASQAISSEIVLNKLLTTLMRIVIENAGAERGALILKLEDKLFLAGLGTAEGESAIDPFVPLEDEDDLSHAIVNYVVRTREVLVLKDAAVSGLFAKDPYIQRCRPRSVLCMPILHKSRLMGVLYLENRLVCGVFSPERLELLRLLISQAAISIENARLYDNLRKAEEKYRSIFENAVEGIYQTTPEGRFISANPAMARILGYASVDELMHGITEIGQQLYVSKEARNEFIHLVRKEREVSGFEVQYFRKDGSKIWASLHARAVYNENGTLNFIEGIFSDITEQKRQTEVLREREEMLRKENLTLKSHIKDRYKFGNIIGKSLKMQEVYELILKASATDVNVIIYGESGTGKELVARAIHQMSDRKEAPFVPVNCGAIPENLLESEFFGYRKGAFTGANMDKMGHFDLAERGTLFLDELGETDRNIQVKLLRVLEGGGYTPVGGRHVRKPNVRVIAATNKNLQDQVKRGLMREDFFYRIHIIPIHLPPLRERKEDIPLLIEHFMNLYGKDKSPTLISGNILEAFQSHEWPGNVRELQNVLHRYITLNTLDILKEPMQNRPKIIDDTGPVSLQGDDAYKIAMADFERKLFKTALEENRWHREKAALSLGIPRRTFFRKLGKMSLFKHDLRQ